MIDTNVLLLTMLFGFLISIITFTVKSANIKITGPSFTINRYAVIGIIVTVLSIFLFPILGKLLGLDVEKYAEPRKIFEKIEEIGNKIFSSS